MKFDIINDRRYTTSITLRHSPLSSDAVTEQIKSLKPRKSEVNI